MQASTKLHLTYQGRHLEATEPNIIEKRNPHAEIPATNFAMGTTRKETQEAYRLRVPPRAGLNITTATTIERMSLATGSSPYGHPDRLYTAPLSKKAPDAH